MKKLIVLIILIVMLPAISYGMIWSGNDALEMGQEYDRYRKGKSYDEARCGVYIGLVVGVYNSTKWMYKKQNLTVNQLCETAYKHLELRKPDSLELGAAYNIKWAFMNAFGGNETHSDLFGKVTTAR